MNESRGRYRTSSILALLLAASITAPRLTVASIAEIGTPAPAVPQGGLLYFVNTTSDTVVAGACANGLANCSLRGAIQAANSHAGTDGIDISLPVGSVINLTSALPDLTDSVDITGPGASALTVRRSSGGSYRIFNVTTTGTVTFSGMTISNGTSGSGGGSGGGIQNVNSGTVNVSQCVISSNTGNSAGGIYNQTSGIMNVSNSTITGNITTDGGYFGGGAGGGILNLIGTVNVANCTISGNTGTEGGGIHTKSNGAVNVSNSTLTGNHALFSGGGLDHSSTATGLFRVKNCIIAGNTSGNPGTSGQDVNGSFHTAGFNLIGKIDGGNGFNAVTDQKGTNSAPLDARLDPSGLQNNGGPTQTIALLFTSPAIDKGTSTGLTGNFTTDQRGPGFPRTFDDPGTTNANGGDGTDIGAFELQTAGPTVLANISTRLRVETSDNVLIGGFIVTGTQPKKVILRALGPSLSVGGTPVPGRLGNTTLELVGPSGTIAINDNWRTGGQEAEIIASTVPPPNDLESAIVATLPANTTAYTAIVRGAGNTSGVGQVEVYDLDRTVDSQLANISTRGLVQTGDNVMIGGVIIVGPGTRRVIVRAVGPSLNVSGMPVAGRLLDTTLEVADQNGMTLAMNDDWRTTQESEIIATTVAPSDGRESAIVATLPAAAYTAIVRGKNGTTGIALVEAFALTN